MNILGTVSYVRVSSVLVSSVQFSLALIFLFSYGRFSFPYELVFLGMVSLV